MTDKQSVRIRIFGTEYTLRGEADEDYMLELARLVDERMRSLGQPGTAQVNRIAILTAFQFADELMKARRALDGERQNQDRVGRQIAQLDLKIQEALSGEAAATLVDGPGSTKEEATPEDADRAPAREAQGVDPPGGGSAVT